MKIITLNLLKFQIGMPQTETIVLTDKLESIVTESIKLTEAINYEKNIDFQILVIQKKLNTVNLKNEKLRLVPYLNVFYSGGFNYGTNTFGDITKFGEYEKYNLVGATLNIPLFSSGQRKYRISQAKIDLEKTENNINTLTQSIDLQLVQFRNNLQDNLDVLKIRTENKVLAEEVYNATKLKNEEGISSNFEVLSSQTDLKTAQTDYYNALYDVLIAQIELDNLLGNFNVESKSN